MKARLITTLLLIIPILGFSQMNQTIDFITGIEYSYRSLSTSSEEEFMVGIMENRENYERGKFNWRIGLNYNIRLSKHIFMKTGLRLASVGYKREKLTGLTWASEYDENGEWTSDPNLAHEIQIVHDYWFTEIPIALRFETNLRKLTPFFELGVSPSFYMTTRTKSITDIGTDSKFQNGDVHEFSKIHVVGLVSCGVNYTISDKFQFFGQPAFRYHLTKIANGLMSEHLYNYGIEIGIRKKIK